MAIILPAVTTAYIGEDSVRATLRAKAATGTLPMACTQIATMRDTVLSTVGKRADQISLGLGNRTTTAEAERTTRLDFLKTKRSELDGVRETRYATLRARVTKDIQKAAVETFVTRVEALVDIRQDAVDEAITAFETGITDLKVRAGTTVTDLRTTVEAELKAVFVEAESACADGATLSSIRTSISTGMAKLKTTHQSNREVYSFRTEFEALRLIRLEAEKKAVVEFEAGLKTATANLKVAFTTT
jgi:hypothetical protein